MCDRASFRVAGFDDDAVEAGMRMDDTILGDCNDQMVLRGPRLGQQDVSGQHRPFDGQKAVGICEAQPAVDRRIAQAIAERISYAPTRGGKRSPHQANAIEPGVRVATMQAERCADQPLGCSGECRGRRAHRGTG